MEHYSGNDPELGCGLLVFGTAILALVVIVVILLIIHPEWRGG